MIKIIIPYISFLILISYILSNMLYFINNSYLNIIIIFISILIQIDNFTLNKEHIMLIGQLNLELHKEKILYNELLNRKNKTNIINWKLLINKFKLYKNLKINKLKKINSENIL